MNNNFLHVIFGLILLVVLVILNSLSGQNYLYEHDALIQCFTVSYLVYWFVATRLKFDFFHPIHIYFIFYFFIFFITPLFLIDTRNTYCNKDNVMGACIRASVIVVLALIALSCGYLKTKNRSSVPLAVKPIAIEKKRKILKLSYSLFVVFYGISVLYALSTGKTVLGILSMGYAGLAQYVDNDALFMINISYFCLVPWLFICCYSENKIVTALTTYLLVALFFTYGWRFIIYIITLGFLITRLRIQGKTLKLSQMILLFAALMFVSVFMGATRGNVRAGGQTQFEGITAEMVSETLESNFNIYQTYYGVVGAYPEKHDYFYGQACFVYPFVIWVPRILWPEKPQGTEFPAGIALRKSCPSALEHAMSFPNIYEYYIDFGPLGVIVFSFLIGILCRKMIDYYNSDSVMKIIIYALFIGFLIQFINRGYLAQLITLFVFLFSPLLLYKKYFKCES